MPDIAKALAMLAGAQSVDDGFFATAATALMEGMGSRLAGISCLSDSGNSVRVLAVAGVPEVPELVQVPVSLIPARSLYETQSDDLLHLTGDFSAMFPTYHSRIDFVAIHEYSALLFRWPDGRPAGHMFIIDEQPVDRGQEDWEFFRLVARRVEAEYSRRSGFAGSIWLDTLVEGAGAGLFLSDLVGEIMLANDTFANWLGQEKGADLVGSRMEDWFGPQELALVNETVAKLLDRGTAEEFEMPFRGHDGDRRDVAVMLSRDETPAGTRILGLLRDITKRREAERAQEESETKFRDLVEGSLEGIFVSDAQMRILFVNPEGARIFGYDAADEMLALENMAPVIAKHELVRMREWRRKLFAGQTVESEQEYQGLRKDGTPVWLHIQSRVVEWDGQPAIQSTLLDITERKRSADERARIEARVRAIFDHAPVSITLKDREGRYVLANKWIEERSGIGFEHLRGRTIAEVLGSTEASEFHATDQKVVHSGKVNVREEVFPFDDQKRLIRTTRFPVRDQDGEVVGTGAFSEELTGQRQVETALRESEARLKAIIDNAPFSIIFKDREGRYVSMNRQAEAWLGATISELSGKMPDAAHVLDGGERDRYWDKQVLSERRIVSYEANREVDGKVKTLWNTKFPILGEDGETEGLGAIASDITDRKQYENLLRRQRHEAERSSDAKTRFLATASHDLRQPLHSMELMLEILARQIHDPKQQDLVADISQAAAIAGGLLNPLLDYSRLEAGMVEPEIEEFPVSSLLRDMEAGFRSQAQDAGLEMRVVPSNAVIKSDPVLLSRIVGNFLSNAIRYTEAGRVLLGCRRCGDILRVEVWDTGPGIDEEHLTSIFEEFNQIETTRRDRDRGLGLGLAIVKAQANLLRHEISVHSRPDRGSAFRIEVPLVRSEPAARQAPVTRVAEPATLEGLRMMILEDNEAILRATKALLERWGCEVATAANREEAIRTAAEDSGQFDLIIADYHLDDGNNGVDAVVQMRSIMEYEVPAIIVTADISNDSLQHATDNHLPLLQKPFRPATLRTAIAISIFGQDEVALS